jgi:hypothetical protein
MSEMLRASLAVAATLLAASQVTLAADPAAGALSGRWEINLAKSQYDPGPAPKSAVRIQQLEGDTLKVALEIIMADGRSGDATYSATLDGKERPAGGGNATIAWTRIDARTLEYRRKRDGQIVESGRLQVSPDGKVLTVESSGVNAAGRKFNDRVVYDRWQDG